MRRLLTSPAAARPAQRIRFVLWAVPLGARGKNPRKVLENKMKSEAASWLWGEGREQLEKGKRIKE